MPERRFAPQPKLGDKKTGELVDFLFVHRTKPLGECFLNKNLIPKLCRKAGVPQYEVRLPVIERGPRLPRNCSMRKSHEFVRTAGMAWAGLSPDDAWKFYDLGHGYCTYDFLTSVHIEWHVRNAVSMCLRDREPRHSLKRQKQSIANAPGSSSQRRRVGGLGRRCLGTAVIAESACGRSNTLGPDPPSDAGSRPRSNCQSGSGLRCTWRKPRLVSRGFLQTRARKVCSSRRPAAEEQASLARVRRGRACAQHPRESTRT
jgi:hypothetical protein